MTSTSPRNVFQKQRFEVKWQIREMQTLFSISPLTQPITSQRIKGDIISFKLSQTKIKSSLTRGLNQICNTICRRWGRTLTLGSTQRVTKPTQNKQWSDKTRSTMTWIKDAVIPSSNLQVTKTLGLENYKRTSFWFCQWSRNLASLQTRLHGRPTTQLEMKKVYRAKSQCLDIKRRRQAWDCYRSQL